MTAREERRLSTWQFVVGALMSIGAGFIIAMTMIGSEVETAMVPIKEDVARNTEQIKHNTEKIVQLEKVASAVLEKLEAMHANQLWMMRKMDERDEAVKEFYRKYGGSLENMRMGK